jgi:cysteinyl-tRNA synthetase
VLIDQGYDPLAYRFFCLSAHYRAKLSFSWEALGAAARSLNRLRQSVYDWGEPGTIDESYAEQFQECLDDDLNLPRAVALAWDLTKSELPAGTKKATMLLFDRVLGLRLAEWKPTVEEVPAEILTLVEQRQQARQEKRWKEADALRAQAAEAGYEIEDTPQGARVKRKKV